jgi:hypothetical protein
MEAFSAVLFVGKQEAGELGRFEWSAQAEPLGSLVNTSAAQRGDNLDVLTLVTVSVAWANERNRREIVLRSVDKITEVTGED